jgi:hypothetical protein
MRGRKRPKVPFCSGWVGCDYSTNEALSTGRVVPVTILFDDVERVFF